MKQYLFVIRNNVMASLTYRAHFIFQVLASVMAITIQYFLWQAVYASNGGGSIKGMTFMDTFVYVSLAAAISVLVRTWVEWGMSGQIRSGDIITYLFKPINHMTWTFFECLGQISANLLTITLPTVLVLFVCLGAQVMAGFNLLVFALALVLAVLLNFFIDYAIGTTCFWTQSIWGVSATKDAMVLLLSGALIPLPLYPDALREALMWLPFAWMYHFPLSVLTARTVDWTYWIQGLAVQAGWVCVFWALVRGYHRLALRKLTVAGG